MRLTYEQALNWLNDNPNASLADLKNLVSQTTAEVSTAKTTLKSK